MPFTLNVRGPKTGFIPANELQSSRQLFRQYPGSLHAAMPGERHGLRRRHVLARPTSVIYPDRNVAGNWGRLIFASKSDGRNTHYFLGVFDPARVSRGFYCRSCYP
jgi:hypothetical protein